MRNTLAVIKRNVTLEARLIDDLLDLTRIMHGRIELRMQPMDFASAAAIGAGDMPPRREGAIAGGGTAPGSQEHMPSRAIRRACIRCSGPPDKRRQVSLLILGA